MSSRNVMGIIVFGLSVLLLSFNGSFAASFPSKTITILIPYSPGGGFDLHTRAIVPGLRKALGVNVILRNTPGAGGNIGWNLLWKAKPDGHTWGVVNIPGAIVSELYGTPKPQYRLKKFSWIGQISAAPYLFAAGANTSFRSLKDLQAAKEVLITDTGVGGTAWVTEALSASVMGFKERFILGYPGAPAANMAITRGEGQARALGLDSPGQMAFVKDGSLIPLWVYLDKRSPDYPEVPTVGELGYPSLRVLASHRVVAAPPGVPKDRMAKIRKAFASAINDPEVQANFKKMNAKTDPIVGEEWDKVLNEFFDLIETHSEVFKEALGQ